MNSFHYLTKSRYMDGLQCKKMLWLKVFKPDLAKPFDTATLHRFDVGKRIGKYARMRFEGGVLIQEDHMHLADAVRSTVAAVKNGAPVIFEATAKYDKILCRADILERVPQKKIAWDIIETKATGEVKDEHYDDLAIQRFCFENAGYHIRGTHLLHVNTSYVRQGDVDPEKFLIQEDVTEMILDRIHGIEKQITEFFSVLSGNECPSVKPGDQCHEPFECPFYDLCNKPVADYSIYELPRAKKLFPILEKMGVGLLKDIPDDFELSQIQKQIVLTNKTRKPVIEKHAIKEYLDLLVYPLAFFDYETISPAIPPFDNCRPYHKTPFQFSLHIQKEKGGECEHHELLLKEAVDPRDLLIEKMLDLLGTKGSIVAWNMGFEKSVIKDLAEIFPEYKQRLLDFLPRFWDLIVPFRRADFAHFNFHGSASLKSVMPVLVPSLSYKVLEIQDGNAASLLYELWISGKLDKTEWEKTYLDLLRYCSLDTWSMAEILRILYKETK
jgi:Domain of unknown function(DUF2779)